MAKSNLKNNTTRKTSPRIQSAGDFLSEILPQRPGTVPMDDIFELIERDKIEPWPEQPRTHISNVQIAAKRNTISEGFQAGKGLSKTGIEMPLIVRYHPDPQKRREGFVMLIDGELRWRGTETTRQDVPLPKALPCNVRDVTEEEAWEIAAVSGVQRQEYTAVQEANIVARLMNGHNKEERRLSVREAAERFGKSKSWVSDRLVVADPDENAPAPAKELIAELQRMVSERSDTLIHARELKKVTDPHLRRRLIRRVIEEGLSLERLRDIIEPKPKDIKIPVSERSDTTPSLDAQTQPAMNEIPPINTPTQDTNFESGSSHHLDVIQAALRPAKTYLAEALRFLDETPPSTALSRKLLHECDELQRQIEIIRERLRIPSL